MSSPDSDFLTSELFSDPNLKPDSVEAVEDVFAPNWKPEPFDAAESVPKPVFDESVPKPDLADSPNLKPDPDVSVVDGPGVTPNLNPDPVAAPAPKMLAPNPDDDLGKNKSEKSINNSLYINVLNRRTNILKQKDWMET